MDYEFSVAQCTLNADVKELLIFIASRCILNFTLIHREWELLISLSNRVTFCTTVVSNVHVTTSFIRNKRKKKVNLKWAILFT